MLWSLLFLSFIGKGILTGRTECREPRERVPATSRCDTGHVNLSNKSSSQSSTYVGRIKNTSDRAYDGDYSTCSKTNTTSNSWWKIDLQDVYNISCISIFNKGGYNRSMNGAKIYIGNLRQNNGTDNTLVKNITNFQKCNSNVYEFKPSVGRYITVFCPEKKPATLCEVNITGTKIASPFKLIKKKMIWEDALYYCRENYMDLASILDEGAQAFAELEAEKADTNYVWLGLHYTCSLQFWFWVDDNTVTFQRWHENSGTENCDMSGTMEKKHDHFWVKKSDYDMYNFICAVR